MSLTFFSFACCGLPYVTIGSAYAHTVVKGEVAAENALYLGKYSASKDGPVVFSGVGHAVDDENYLVTKVQPASDWSQL